MDLDGIWRNTPSESVDPDIRISVDVKPCEADGDSRWIGIRAKYFGILRLGFALRTNIEGIKTVGISGGNNTSRMIASVTH
jgi:hypothetical protein